MQLEKAFRLAVTLSWGDLRKVERPASVRVEYERESDSPLDHVTVWLDKGGGYYDRVCDYWTGTSPDHPLAIRFWKGHDSEQLAQALAFIMKNQSRFTAPTTARKGLVIVYPPGDEERAEAATWEKAELGTNRGGKEGFRDEALIA